MRGEPEGDYLGLFKGEGREIGARKQQRGERREKGEARELLVSVPVGVGGGREGTAAGGGEGDGAELSRRIAASEAAGIGGSGGAALGWYWASPAPEAAIADGRRSGRVAGVVGPAEPEPERAPVLGEREERRERRGGMRRGKGGRNGLLPSSLRIISSCLKTVSSNAGSVASTVRSAGASVAASIAPQAEDEKDQVGCAAPLPLYLSKDFVFYSRCYCRRDHRCWGFLTLALRVQPCTQL